MNELTKNEKIHVENFERIDKIRLIVLAVLALAISGIMYTNLQVLVSQSNSLVVYIPIIICIVLVVFTFYAIYGYVKGKITLTNKAIVFSGIGKDKRIELSDIEEISMFGVQDRKLIKAIVYNLLFGRYTLIFKLKNEQDYNYPKVSSGLFPSGFREVKAQELIDAVMQQKTKLDLQ